MKAKPLKAIFDFYLYGNLHVALCAVAMLLVTQHLFDYPLRLELFVFVFCGTFFLYNLQRLPSAFANEKIVHGDSHGESEFVRHKWNTDHKFLLAIISGIAAIAAGWSFFQLYHRSQVVALVPALLSLAYAFPVIRWNGKWKKLREFKVLKIFIVSIVWGMICTLLPAAAADFTGENWFTIPVLTWFLACCGIIFSLTIPFDIRDLHYDGQQLKTLPSILGIRKSMLLALFVLALSDALVFSCTITYGKGGIHAFIAFFLWSIITAIFIWESTPTRPEYYFSFFIDGLMMLLLGFLTFESYI